MVKYNVVKHDNCKVDKVKFRNFVWKIKIFSSEIENNHQDKVPENLSIFCMENLENGNLIQFQRRVENMLPRLSCFLRTHWKVTSTRQESDGLLTCHEVIIADELCRHCPWKPGETLGSVEADIAGGPAHGRAPRPGVGPGELPGEAGAGPGPDPGGAGARSAD